MADDLVNRIHQRLWRAPAEYHGLLRDAADEIKRLRDVTEAQRNTIADLELRMHRD